MKCSYCGAQACERIKKEEVITFKGQKIKLRNIRYKVCTNPKCKEPIWLCGTEGIKRENQIRQQLGMPLVSC